MSVLNYMSRMTLYPTCLMCLTYLRALSAHYLTCLPAFITFPPLCLPFLCVMHAFSILRAFVFTHALYDLIFCVPCVPSFFYVLSFFKYVHYFKCSYFTYMYSLFLYAFIFYMCLHFFGALHAFVFNGLHCLRTFTFLCAYILFTSFRFFYMLSYFLRAS